MARPGRLENFRRWLDKQRAQRAVYAALAGTEDWACAATSLDDAWAKAKHRARVVGSAQVFAVTPQGSRPVATVNGRGEDVQPPPLGLSEGR